MKNIVLVLWLPLWMMSNVMLAQQETTTGREALKRDPALMQEKVLDNLKQELALTEEQSEKIKELMQKREAEAKAELAEQKAEQEALRQKRAEKAKARQKAYNQQMKEVLTQEQYIRYLELKEEKREQFIEQRKDQRKDRVEQRKDRRPLNQRRPANPAGVNQ